MKTVALVLYQQIFTNKYLQSDYHHDGWDPSRFVLILLVYVCAVIVCKLYKRYPPASACLPYFNLERKGSALRLFA